MKKWILLAAAAMMIFALTACSSATKSGSSASGGAKLPDKLSKPVTITFWHAMNGGQEKALQQLVTEFEQQHKNITVKLVNQGAYNDLSTKLTAAAKAHTLPVMAQAYENWMSGYIKNNLIDDLTTYENSSKYGWSASDKKDIVKVFLDSNTFNGKLYGVPFNKSTEVLFYNTDYLKQHDLAVPKTWSELKNVAEQTTGTVNGKKVVGLGFENSIGFDFPSWVRQAGGQYANEKANKLLFNSKQGKAALNFLDSMMKEGSARLAGEDNYMSGPFSNGNVAMYIGSSAGMSFVQSGAKGKVNWATAPLPKDKVAATPFQGTNLVMFSSATADQKLAAWELMKFLSDNKQTMEWAKATGYVPVRLSVLSDPQWKSFVKANPTYAAAEKQFGSGFFELRSPGTDQVSNVLTQEMQAVFLGKETVDQALQNATTKGQQVLEQAKSN
ncbi:MAG: ABC transporter substrate-binding protein [Sporolactobacillus sp.]